MEEVQNRHRKELRDLQSRTTQKKKQASKKTRKSVNDGCDKLEAELKERQQAEIAALDNNGIEGSGEELSPEEMQKLTLQVSDEEEDNRPQNESKASAPGVTPSNDDVSEEAGPKKRNRQKERLARRAAEQEELARQAIAEARNLPDKKKQERDRMLESMKAHGRIEKEIRADGHCLYSAVADQLDQLGIPIGAAPDEKPSLPFEIVRAKAADYIEAHEEDFVPFLEEPLFTYVHKVRDTGEWGGQLELMALAKTYGADINVLQDFGRVEKVEAGNGGGSEKAIWLGYYKHGFGLGEHYNSLRKA